MSKPFFANSKCSAMLCSVSRADAIRALYLSSAINSRCAAICCKPSAKAAPVEVFGFLLLSAPAGTTSCVNVCATEKGGERRSDDLPPRFTTGVVGAWKGGFGGESSDWSAPHPVGGASSSSS